jgi:hypothetical protein
MIKAAEEEEDMVVLVAVKLEQTERIVSSVVSQVIGLEIALPLLGS